MTDLLANWTGALTTAVGAVVDVAYEPTHHTDAAALLTCFYFPGTTVGELGEVLALTDSGAVRLVNRMERAGLLRRDARRGRVVTLRATGDGRRLALDLQARRLRAIDSLFSSLTTDERAQLAGLLHKVLGGVEFGGRQARQTCRHCDHRRCDGEVCPIGQRLRDQGELAPRVGKAGV